MLEEKIYISCKGCQKDSPVELGDMPVQYHNWSRNDYNGFFTGVYCDKCYEDPEKYPFRKDNYNQDAIENGEDIWGEDEY